VTDADLLLGALNASNFLGGEMALALDKVRDAVRRKLAVPLGLSEAEAARGIQEIVNESMAGATRMHLAEKGRDPRDFTLFAFGGAGPVHAYALARMLGVRRVIVPLGAGVISAFGFLVAPPSVGKVRGYVTGLERADWAHVERLYADMEREARAVLAGGDMDLTGLKVEASADMRYAGQGFEIEVPLPAGLLAEAQLLALREAFALAYRQRFDRVVRGVGIEVVNWRLTVSLPAQDMRLGGHGEAQGASERGRRTVYFHGHGDLLTTVHDRYRLQPGELHRGPAVVEERETSCAFGPDCSFHVDAHANLVVELDPVVPRSAALSETPHLAPA
jgi:N-methylhydantoinase A